MTLSPTRNPCTLSVVLGTQSVYDSIDNPAITSLFSVVRSGYKLTYLGTDATGVGVYGRADWGRFKVSLLPMGAAQPNKASEGDARFSYAWLGTLDYAYDVQPGTRVGLSYWHLSDETQGRAFAYEGLVPSGPSSGSLSAYTGTAPLRIDQPVGDVHYVGLNAQHNLDFHTGRLAASGFVMLNVGSFESEKDDTQRLEKVDLMGVSANAEVVYKWGRTAGDRVKLQALWARGDDDLSDDEFKAPFTLNDYGLPGAVWFDHEMLLLFPFTSTVSNYSGAVTDISNQGYGLTTALAVGAWDIVPDRLNLKLGAGWAMANEDPPAREDGRDPGKQMGVELNAELRWHLRYLMTVGLHGGYLLKGAFYDDNTQVEDDPWAVFTTFTWYAF